MRLFLAFVWSALIASIFTFSSYDHLSVPAKTAIFLLMGGLCFFTSSTAFKLKILEPAPAGMSTGQKLNYYFEPAICTAFFLFATVLYSMAAYEGFTEASTEENASVAQSSKIEDKPAYTVSPFASDTMMASDNQLSASGYARSDDDGMSSGIARFIYYGFIVVATFLLHVKLESVNRISNGSRYSIFAIIIFILALGWVLAFSIDDMKFNERIWMCLLMPLMVIIYYRYQFISRWDEATSDRKKEGMKREIRKSLGADGWASDDELDKRFNR